MPSKKIKPGLGKGGRPKKKHRTMTHALTDMQELFVQEYCVDLSPKNAAIRAGYSEKGANSVGQKLMNNPDVVDKIRLQLGKRAEETEINATKVLYELALIAFSDPGHMFDGEGNLLHIMDMPEGIRKSIAGCDIISREGRDGTVRTTAKVKFWNKVETLSLIGKHLGILGSNVEQKHLHLHSAATNPYLNAPDDLILQAKDAMTMLEHSVKANIIDEDR